MATTRNIKCESMRIIKRYSVLTTCHCPSFHLDTSIPIYAAHTSDCPFYCMTLVIHQVLSLATVPLERCALPIVLMSRSHFANVLAIDMSSYQLHNQCFPGRICPNSF